MTLLESQIAALRSLAFEKGLINIVKRLYGDCHGDGAIDAKRHPERSEGPLCFAQCMGIAMATEPVASEAWLSPRNDEYP